MPGQYDNVRCPRRDKHRCQGPVCGHCSVCHQPLDLHDGLTMNADVPRCPTGKAAPR